MIQASIAGVSRVIGAVWRRWTAVMTPTCDSAASTWVSTDSGPMVGVTPTMVVSGAATAVAASTMVCVMVALVLTMPRVMPVREEVLKIQGSSGG